MARVDEKKAARTHAKLVDSCSHVCVCTRGLHFKKQIHADQRCRRLAALVVTLPQAAQPLSCVLLGRFLSRAPVLPRSLHLSVAQIHTHTHIYTRTRTHTHTAGRPVRSGGGALARRHTVDARARTKYL